MAEDRFNFDHLIALLHSRSGKLILVFAGFVVIQLLCAAVYYLLYRRSRYNFTFNADILESQSDTIKAATETNLTRLHAAQDALNELRDRKSVV